MKIKTNQELYPTYNKNNEEKLSQLIIANNDYQYFADEYNKNIILLNKSKDDLVCTNFFNYKEKRKKKFKDYVVKDIIVTIVASIIAFLLVVMSLQVMSASNDVNRYSQNFSNKEVIDFYKGMEERRSELKEENPEKSFYELNAVLVSELKKDKRSFEIYEIIHYGYKVVRLKFALLFAIGLVFFLLGFNLIGYIFNLMIKKPKILMEIKGKSMEIENNKRKLNEFNNLYMNILNQYPLFKNKNIKDVILNIYLSPNKSLNLLNSRTLDSTYCLEKNVFFNTDINLNRKFSISGKEHFYLILENTNYYRKMD